MVLRSADRRWTWQGRSAYARLLGPPLLAFQGTLVLATGYLLALLVAARNSARDPAHGLEQGEATLRLVVLIPAHDEQDGIRLTLDSLARSEYPRERLRVVVVADNCTDATAERAREAGVEVWAREDSSKRGKGHALSWAWQRLDTAHEDFDGVVVLDADCLVSPNMLSVMEARMRSGAHAVQVNYVVGNPDASHASALRFAAFALMDTVRPLGKQRLGLSCGLFGTGMAFTRELMRREPWSATGLVEDGEHHMRLVQAGERADFAEDACVSSAMPTSLRNSSDQQARWEQGKLQLIRRWTPPLVASGLTNRDVVRVHAGLEQLVPPQSLIAAGSIASALAGLLLGSRRLIALSAATLVGQIVFVLGGLRLVRAPVQVYRALLVAPLLIVNKVGLYTRLLVGGGPTSWVRTQRESSAPDAERT